MIIRYSQINESSAEQSIWTNLNHYYCTKKVKEVEVVKTYAMVYKIWPLKTWQLDLEDLFPASIKESTTILIIKDIEQKFWKIEKIQKTILIYLTTRLLIFCEKTVVRNRLCIYYFYGGEGGKKKKQLKY